VSMVPDHVAVSVPDLVAARDWYAAAFVLEPGPVFEIGGSDVSGVVLVHGSGFRLELLHRPGSTPGTMDAASGPDEATLTHGYGHLCWRSDDVPGAHERLVSLGACSRVEPRPSPSRPGATVCFVTDPWGNLVEVLDRPEETA
jgi:catechol 2,3-dioxygenase-like lactoylglutathione lyase family enzyme